MPLLRISDHSQTSNLRDIEILEDPQKFIGEFFFRPEEIMRPYQEKDEEIYEY